MTRLFATSLFIKIISVGWMFSLVGCKGFVPEITGTSLCRALHSLVICFDGHV